jgi:hypothetical protein
MPYLKCEVILSLINASSPSLTIAATLISGGLLLGVFMQLNTETVEQIDLEAIKHAIEENPSNYQKYLNELYTAVKQPNSPKWIFDLLVQHKNTYAFCSSFATAQTMVELELHPWCLSITNSIELVKYAASLGYKEVVSNPLFTTDLLVSDAHPYLQIEHPDTPYETLLHLVEHPDAAVRFRVISTLIGDALTAFADERNQRVAVLAAWKSQKYVFCGHTDPVVRAMHNVSHFQPCSETEFWQIHDLPEVSIKHSARNGHQSIHCLLEQEVLAEFELNALPDDPTLFHATFRCKVMTPEVARLRAYGHSIIKTEYTNLNLTVRKLLQHLGITRVIASSRLEDDESTLDFCEYFAGEISISENLLINAIKTDDQFSLLRHEIGRFSSLNEFWFEISNGCYIEYDVETDTHASFAHS